MVGTFIVCVVLCVLFGYARMPDLAKQGAWRHWVLCWTNRSCTTCRITMNQVILVTYQFSHYLCMCTCIITFIYRARSASQGLARSCRLLVIPPLSPCIFKLQAHYQFSWSSCRPTQAVNDGWFGSTLGRLHRLECSSDIVASRIWLDVEPTTDGVASHERVIEIPSPDLSHFEEE